MVMDERTTIFKRVDPAERTRRPRTLDQFTDAEILAADGLVLVDPQKSEWQEVLWSAEIGEGAITSMTLKILEIAVDSGRSSEIVAARDRVRRIKGGK